LHTHTHTHAYIYCIYICDTQGLAGLAIVEDGDEYEDVDPFAGDDIPDIDGLQD
jgi:hypothetical protein